MYGHVYVHVYGHVYRMKRRMNNSIKARASGMQTRQVARHGGQALVVMHWWSGIGGQALEVRHWWPGIGGQALVVRHMEVIKAG